jgi:FkbM family methyltransferase
MSLVIRTVGLIALVVVLLLLPIVPDPDPCRSAEGRCVLIDGGAHRGETIAHFEKTRTFGKHDWEIIAFEANPYLVSEIAERPHLTLLNQAIWNEDEELEFFLARQSEGSSVFGDKKSGSLQKEPVKVEAVDFSRWLREGFAPEDRVLAKLDIEGAEYDVLDELLADGTAGLIDRLYVEFHNVKVGVDQARDVELTAALREKGVEVRRGRSDVAGDWFPDWISLLELLTERRLEEILGRMAPA